MLKVWKSKSGYYIADRPDPDDREPRPSVYRDSVGYYSTRKEAQKAIDTGSWK